ncbi:hypothetical protein [Snodgrassella sp. CFCC 13594]|uniref:hypothetical protein n=1 Tax=Snodgrassella sp. CFCC 13594 TaxID=1775559 RepID=UPI00082E8EA0|nr:hypothetical protein [Snodgrassella sp. CFCC 13594]
MLISEAELYQMKMTSFIYKDLPYAVIFYREMKRKNFLVAEKLNPNLFYNFFNRFDPNQRRLEILFPDNSTLIFDFKVKKCHVYHPQSIFIDTIDLL